MSRSHDGSCALADARDPGGRVRAGDAHPISGSFRVEVVEPAPVAADGDATRSTTPAVRAEEEAPGTERSEDGDALAMLLADHGDTGGGAAVGRVGRTLTFTGTIFGVGALAALVWVVRGRRDELRSVLGWVRLAGLAVTTGGLVELAALRRRRLPARASCWARRPVSQPS